MKARKYRGLSGEEFTPEEVEVISEALDEYEQAKRYAAALQMPGDKRHELLGRAGVASRLLKRCETETEHRRAS